MASGSCYTSTLNTFMMIMSCLFVGHKNNITLLPQAAGDDVVVETYDYYSDVELLSAFYSVFKKPDMNCTWGNGLVLKYCAITCDFNWIKPCSTENCICVNHGVKLFRPFYKMLHNTAFNDNLLKFQDKVTQRYFKNLIIQGEKKWANSIEIYALLFNLFGAENSTEGRMKYEAFLQESLKGVKNNMGNDQDSIWFYKKNRYLCNYLENSYIGDRTHELQPCCIRAYEDMLSKLYGSPYTELVCKFRICRDSGCLKYGLFAKELEYYNNKQSKLEQPIDDQLFYCNCYSKVNKRCSFEDYIKIKSLYL